jgi:16S rRNA (adenine(1408)-N(1))-methyltransferase
METIRGKTSLEIPASEFADCIANYRKVKMDIGTGDGRYVRCLAQQNPDEFFIGIDACRENLKENSQAKLPNALYVIANAQSLPPELTSLADEISINFPWGSLLVSLLTCDQALLSGLMAICKPSALLHVRLNGGALQEAGWELEEGAQQVYQTLFSAGFRVGRPSRMNASDLRACSTTWARRLAFGRDPRAYYLSAKWMKRIAQFQTSWARVARV